jgi:hypothetical protein
VVAKCDIQNANMVKLVHFEGLEVVKLAKAVLAERECMWLCAAKCWLAFGWWWCSD